MIEMDEQSQRMKKKKTSRTNPFVMLNFIGVPLGRIFKAGIFFLNIHTTFSRQMHAMRRDGNLTR